MQVKQESPASPPQRSLLLRTVALALILQPIIMSLLLVFCLWQQRPDGIDDTDKASLYTYPALLAVYFTSRIFYAFSLPSVLMSCWLLFARRFTALNIALSLLVAFISYLLYWNVIRFFWTGW